MTRYVIESKCNVTNRWLPYCKHLSHSLKRCIELTVAATRNGETVRIIAVTRKIIKSKEIV